MKPEDKVVEEVVAYFSEPKFSKFSIIKECEIQMGTDNRAADIVLREADGKFVVIAECKSPGGANYGIPQLKSYLSATDTPFGIFAPRIERDSWVFYENLRHNRFQQIDLSEFEKGVLLKEEDEMAENIVLTGTSSKTEYSNVPIGTSNPGCIIILVDQSFSMSESFGNDGSKAERAALAVNRVLEELVLACREGEEIRERCHVTVIGYGVSVNSVIDGMISELLSAMVEVKKVKKLTPDGAGGLVEYDAEVPIWLESKANGSTPMHEAFQRAADIIERWIPHRPDSFPPIVINITDGAATRPDLAGDAARKIMNLRTTDGASLIFNLHISNSGNTITPLPHNTDQFSDQPLAEYLFDISSAFPPELFKAAEEAGFSLEPGARCFGYNMNEESMIRILQFGSLGLTQVRALPFPQD